MRIARNRLSRYDSIDFLDSKISSLWLDPLSTVIGVLPQDAISYIYIYIYTMHESASKLSYTVTIYIYIYI